MDYPVTSALIQECTESNLPSTVEVSPALVMSGKKSLTVTLTNLSTNTVCLAPMAILCELHPVEVTAEVLDGLEEENLDITKRI
ncbi:hypothetical protein DPMN_041255 [Dreissena polymorpha]|uniref:Uncharacterized protein n=1 Tax=Dreissena polymorpha TaxID=45954 RepID=A0A9D4CWH4_DREPO|nr:hypothetical protein DPMN_041255 [Dreissena polymorpha]